MKKKYWTTRMLSGVLSAVMVVSVAIIPMTASVAASPRKDEDIKNLFSFKFLGRIYFYTYCLWHH